MSPSKYISIASACQVTAAPHRTWDAEPASGVPGLSADSQGWALVVWPGLLLQQAIPWGRRGKLRVRPCAISEVPITS